MTQALSAASEPTGRPKLAWLEIAASAVRFERAMVADRGRRPAKHPLGVLKWRFCGQG